MANPTSSSKCLVGLGLHGIRNSPPMPMPAQFKSVVELSKRIIMSQSHSKSPKSQGAGSTTTTKLFGASPLLESFISPRFGDSQETVYPGARGGMTTRPITRTPRAGYQQQQSHQHGSSPQPQFVGKGDRDDKQGDRREAPDEKGGSGEESQPFFEVPFALRPDKSFRLHASPLVSGTNLTSPSTPSSVVLPTTATMTTTTNATTTTTNPGGGGYTPSPEPGAWQQLQCREDNYSTMCSPSTSPLLPVYDDGLEGLGKNALISGSCSPVAKIETVLGPKNKEGVDLEFEKRDYRFLYSRLKQNMSPTIPLSERIAADAMGEGGGKNGVEVAAAVLRRSSPLTKCVATFERLGEGGDGGVVDEGEGKEGKEGGGGTAAGTLMTINPLLVRAKDGLGIGLGVQMDALTALGGTQRGTGLDPLTSQSSEVAGEGDIEEDKMLETDALLSHDTQKAQQTPDTPTILPSTRTISGTKELDELTMSPLQLPPGVVVAITVPGVAVVRDSAQPSSVSVSLGSVIQLMRVQRPGHL